MSAVLWPLAAGTAARLAGRYPLEGSYHFALLARQAPGLVNRAAELVTVETRLPWVGDPQVGVLTRADWARASVASFGRLLAPAEARLAAAGPGPGRRLAGGLLGAEVGALVGVLARRVLGQYELVVPTGDGGGDMIMLVGGNLLAMERRHSLRPTEFRLWVALHECTHRLQFTGVPWMSGHFQGLVGRLLESVADGPPRLPRPVGNLRSAARGRRRPMDETGLMGLLATPAQRQLIDEVQALMSVLEGHGHAVMDRIGARVLVSQPHMARVLNARRRDPRFAVLMRLIGLEMKMKQYELGERFMQAVERQGGFSAIDRLWESPRNLPTLDEIRDPSRWLQRVA